MKFYLDIFSILKNYKLLFFILITIISLQAFLNILSVILVGYFISILTNGSFSLSVLKFLQEFEIIDLEILSTNNLILIFAIFIFILSLINMFIHYYSTRIKYIVICDYLHKSLSLILNSSSKFFSKYDKGKLLNSYSKELDKMASGISNFAKMLPLIFQFAVFIILPLFINLKLSLLIYLLILLLTLLVVPLTKLGKKYGKNNTLTGNYFMKFLGEIFNFNLFIISHNKQKLILNKIIKTYKEHSIFAIKSSTLDTSPQILFPSLIILVLAIILNMSSESLNSYVAQVSMITFSLFRGLPIISTLFSYHLKIYTFNEAFTQLEDINSTASNSKNNFGKKNVKNIQKIFLNELCFNYKKNKIIDNLSLTFEIGKINLITGESGSGKSTLVQLLTGYMTPSSGEILINDKFNLNQLDINQFRNKISYLTQDCVIFNASLKENITWFDKSISDAKVKDTLRLLKLDYFIKRMNDPLNMILNDINSNISGGEKQRIAIARLLLQDTELILLDEITSSLDKENSYLIYNIMKKISKSKIVVAISHDPIWINSNAKKTNLIKI